VKDDDHDNGNRQQPERSVVERRLLSQQPRLMSRAGQAGAADTPPIEVKLRHDEAEVPPAVLLRIGERDLTDVCAAVDEAINPAGLVVALSDRPHVVVAANRASRRVDVPLLTDPAFFRCVLKDGRISDALASQPYAPTREQGVWRLSDLSGRSLKLLVREVFEAQTDRQRGAWMAPTVTNTADREPLRVNRALLRASVETRSAYGREPLIAPLIIDADAFCDLDNQVRIVNTLTGINTDGYLVSLSGADSDAPHLAAKLRLLLLIKTLGVPVVLAKAGPMRAFALALGLGGFETGLGRLERFALTDFLGGGGQGNNPAKFEIAQILTALRPDLAHRARTCGVLGEPPCACAACTNGWRPGDTKGTVFHDASVIADDVRAATGRDISRGLGELRAAVSKARRTVDDLLDAGVDVQHETEHLARWAEAIEIVKQWGLDEPDAAQRLRDAA
jgi:hypothetical protein